MSGKRGKAAGSQWRFKIEAFTPDTLPMARLAEYLTQLAEILGEPRSVHLVRIERGSTILVNEIDHDAVTTVHKRVSLVREGKGPKTAIDAVRRMNVYLAQDNARAFLQGDDDNDDLLVFAGSGREESDSPTVNQTGTVSGVVIRVGGVGSRVPVLLDSGGKQVTGCHAARQTAKELAQYLFEPVKLYGDGQWSRGSDGSWDVDRFKIARFDPLDASALSQVLATLRPIAATWGDEVLEDLEVI